MRVERLTLTGLPPLLDSALNNFNGDGPHSNVFMNRLFAPHLQLLADDGDKIPAYLFVGNETMLAKVFGAEYAVTAPGTRGMPPREIGDPLACRYWEVSEDRTPCADRIVCRYEAHRFQYVRLILPTLFGNGARSFSAFVHLERSFRVQPQPSNEDL